ncbi:hypothetical protein [Cellvibrio sp. PSBB023]|uniref:hypothetical protein n=1 Tax=Cellvibrio sp. PSBB023 TaxID=1945512 RepID=UPI00098F1B14|nr:hypothetical protein [Cellvibrio sp. PSBB023]AQT59013.1 hypothetical protein B0D95_02090 [Cellvibrio sp. PSBB023]
MKTLTKTYGWAQAMFSAALFCCASGASAAITKMELAGNSLAVYPFFEYIKAVNVNSALKIAIDPTRFPAIAGQTCDVYVVAAKKTIGWDVDQTLTDVTTGGALTVTFSAANIQANTYQVAAPFELNANAGMGLGVGYDVVLDCNQDGILNGDDYIDGRNNESGFYAVSDTTAPGPMAVTELDYNLSNAVSTTYGINAGLRSQNLFYPTNVAAANIDKNGDGNPDGLPLIIISHGNGHNYAWYDHIGRHLASYGYVVVSHSNNTMPGPVSASQTTLAHTDAFIDQVAAGVIAGGALTGHLNSSKITWIGHSRGGEGVAIAYDALFDGTVTPVNYGKANIKLISSMLPTDFNGTNIANPQDANFHLWTASGDADVHGGADNNIAQTYHLHDRATANRQSTTVQGAGHGWFHNNPAASAAFTGPCSIGIANTHLIELGHFLPLVKRYVEDNIPSLDFLTRQYESFRPIGVPTGNPCIVVSHEYRDASTGVTPPGGAFPPGVKKSVVIDDYQSQFATNLSSIGAPVNFNVTNLTEGRLDDNNTDFAWTPSDPFNGATQAGPLDTSRGVVFDWNGVDRFYEWEIPVAEQNFVDNLILSFRGAQATRHPNTVAALGDLTFKVTLRDTSSVTSSINIGAFGGGLEEPYQRSGGWHNEMETIRIRLTDFLNNGSGLDLSHIAAIRLDVGPSHGSAEGRIVIDELMLTNDRAVYDANDNGDPHLKTVNGVHYDFQSAGEFVLLREGSAMEIQARQTPVPSAAAITNPYTGLKSCVSVNTAVVARVGKHRVSYQPNISGEPDPSGMQLRIDGKLIDMATLQSINLGSGARVSKSPTGNGIEINFPNGTSLIALPQWWGYQQKWFLNLTVFNTPATEGILGYIHNGDWLPLLPNGTSLGARPALLAQRYIDLNQTFANAWRVSEKSSLFDYLPGTSTHTFTYKDWPAENSSTCVVSGSPQVVPIAEDVARKLCARVSDKNHHANCVKDVAVTGEKGFAQAFLESQKVDAGATITDVLVKQDSSKVSLAAVIKYHKTEEIITRDKTQEKPIGVVQFMINGEKVSEPIELEATGVARWATRLDVGKYRIGAVFTPAKEGDLLPSTSQDTDLTVQKTKR